MAYSAMTALGRSGLSEVPVDTEEMSARLVDSDMWDHVRDLADRHVVIDGVLHRRSQGPLQ
jgi:hypothetical protein